MSRKDGLRVSVRGTQNVGEGAKAALAAKTSVSTVGVGRLPKLAPPKPLMSGEQREKFRAELAEVSDVLRQYGEVIGNGLKEPDLDLLMNDIRRLEGKAVAAVLATEEGNPRHQAAEAYFTALATAIPATALGLNHLADQGLAVGILRRVSDGGGVHLPVTPQDGGRWKWVDLRPPLTCEGLLRAIQKIAGEAQKSYEADKKSRRDALQEGTKSLLEALKTGGEACFYTPNYVVKGREYWGGMVRVSVDPVQGQIYPVGAEGGVYKDVRQAKELGVKLPTTSLEEDNLRLPEWVEQDAFYASLSFHGLCRRGYLFAKEGERRKEAFAEMKSKGNVSPNDFVLRDVTGRSFLFLKNGWTVGKGEDAKEYHRVSFLAERNEAGELRVAKCFPQLEELFTGCREFMAPGEKFSGLAYPLGQMLRTLYAALSNAERHKDAGPGVPEPKGAETDGRDEYLPRPEVKAQAEARLAADRNGGSE